MPLTGPLTLIQQFFGYPVLFSNFQSSRVRQCRIRGIFYNFVNEVVVAEEWREDFRMSRGNYHGLNVLLTGACSKRDKAVAPPIKRCSVDAEHMIRFHVWTENFCSFFAPKVAFSNLSGIVWTRPDRTQQSRLGRSSRIRVSRYCFR